MANTTKIYNPVLSQDRVLPTSSSFGNGGVGIALPIGSANDGTFFKQTYTSLDAAKANIKNLILTVPGERIMHPSLGTNIWKMLFEPTLPDSGMSSIVEDTIRDAVSQWLPYIGISYVQVIFDDVSLMLSIELGIFMKSDPTTTDKMFVSISKGDL